MNIRTELKTRNGKSIESVLNSSLKPPFLSSESKHRQTWIISKPCPRCGGKGILYQYVPINGGLCFRCNGKCSTAEKISFYTQEKLEKFYKKEIEKQQKEEIEKQQIIENNFKRIDTELKECFNEIETSTFFKKNAILSIYQQALHKSLTDIQINFLNSLFEEYKEFKQIESEKRKEVVEGKMVVYGIILGTKIKYNYYNGCEELKMLVDIGNCTIFGSVPKSIINEELKGRKIEFTATLESKEPGFSIFKRPSKVTLD